MMTAEIQSNFKLEPLKICFLIIFKQALSNAVQKFLNIMDDPKNYPVLIHCHHGVGRSRLFSSIYRSEYENFTNEDARENARLFWEFGTNFSKSSEKVAYLMIYHKRAAKIELK